MWEKNKDLLIFITMFEIYLKHAFVLSEIRVMDQDQGQPCAVDHRVYVCCNNKGGKELAHT